MQITHSKRHYTSIIVLSSIAFYCFYYLANIALPGNNGPLGWWGWFDQGQYLKGALALSRGDFSPDNHYYPPLYPFLGSLFIKALPLHPFFFINGLAFILFTYCFMVISTRYCSFWLSLVLYAASVYFNRPIMSTFVVPWSTACTITVFSVALLLFAFIEDHPRLPLKQLNQTAFILSLTFGLLALARPIDALLAIVFFPAFLILCYINDPGLPFKARLWRGLPLSAILFIGPISSACLFFWFNTKVFGSAFGGYFNSTANGSGYFPFELAKKTLSLISDSYTLYLAPRASLLTHYPWLALSIAGMVLSVWRGDVILKILCAAIVVHFSLYAPYGDLLPNGVWRFVNIHYFKWMLPYLALFAWLSLYWIGKKSGSNALRPILSLAAVSIVVGLTFSISLKTHSWTVQTVAGKPSVIVLPVNDQAIDFIDIPGVTGQFAEIYFGRHQLWLDGNALDVVKDYRVLPAPDGVRVLFNQTRHGQKIEIQFDPRLVRKPAPSLSLGNYYITLGIPRLRHD